MKKRNIKLRDERLEFRISAKAKMKLRSTSEEYGLSMGTILNNLIEGLPVDNIKEKHFQFMAIHNLATEINYIGKNINQVTVALRQIASERRIEDGEFEMLSKLIIKYETKLSEVKAVVLEKFR